MIYGFGCVLITRLQNTEYPHHKQLLPTIREMIRHDRLRMFYLGLAPLMINAAILSIALYAAVFTKRTFVAELKRQERREFFETIDWTQPEKIKEDDLK